MSQLSPDDDRVFTTVLYVICTVGGIAMGMLYTNDSHKKAIQDLVEDQQTIAACRQEVVDCRAEVRKLVRP